MSEVRRSLPPVRVDAYVGWRPACACVGSMTFMPSPIWRSGQPFDLIQLVGWTPPRCAACAKDFVPANNAPSVNPTVTP